MRNALLGALVLLVAACGAYHFPGDQSGTGGVSGTVEVIGCGPVQPAGGICAPSRPMPGAEIVFTNGGTSQTAITAQDGTYSIQLPAGTYKVTFKAPLIIVSGPRTVTVRSGANQQANYVVDSGIRAPLPQQ